MAFKVADLGRNNQRWHEKNFVSDNGGCYHLMQFNETDLNVSR